MEGGGYLVSWCVGYLVELSPPESYDERYGKWQYEDLPIRPKDWRFQVSASTRKQFTVLKKLMERQDVTGPCATDAGREGEQIFRLVYRESGCHNPFERLWISSMEDVAIRGFIPEPFYTVELDMGGFRLKSGRIRDREEAAQMLRACHSAGQAVITKTEQKAKYDRPPLLYDLTSLQRDANRIIGFTAQ